MQDQTVSLQKRVAEVEGQLAAHDTTSSESDTLPNQLEAQRSNHPKVLEKYRMEKRDAQIEIFELKIKITQLESDVKVVSQDRDRC